MPDGGDGGGGGGGEFGGAGAQGGFGGDYGYGGAALGNGDYGAGDFGGYGGDVGGDIGGVPVGSPYVPPAVSSPSMANTAAMLAPTTEQQRQYTHPAAVVAPIYSGITTGNPYQYAASPMQTRIPPSLAAGGGTQGQWEGGAK